MALVRHRGGRAEFAWPAHSSTVPFGGSIWRLRSPAGRSQQKWKGFNYCISPCVWCVSVPGICMQAPCLHTGTLPTEPPPHSLTITSGLIVLCILHICRIGHSLKQPGSSSLGAPTRSASVLMAGNHLPSSSKLPPWWWVFHSPVLCGWAQCCGVCVGELSCLAGCRGGPSAENT